MDIPNLSQPEVVPAASSSKVPLIIVVISAIIIGLVFSKVAPITKTKSNSQTPANTAISADTVKSAADIKVGQSYGDTETIFKDAATGTLEKGSINGEGTHILNRPGGADQRASLTSSVLDLDLFVGRQVEVHGQTNASTKTGWLLDVGTVKVLQ